MEKELEIFLLNMKFGHLLKIGKMIHTQEINSRSRDWTWRHWQPLLASFILQLNGEKQKSVNMTDLKGLNNAQCKIKKQPKSQTKKLGLFYLTVKANSSMNPKYQKIKTLTMSFGLIKSLRIMSFALITFKRNKESRTLTSCLFSLLKNPR